MIIKIISSNGSIWWVWSVITYYRTVSSGGVGQIFEITRHTEWRWAEQFAEWQPLTVSLGSTFWTTGGLTENERVGNIVFPPQRQIWCQLFLLKELRSLNVSKDILIAVYKSLLSESSRTASHAGTTFPLLKTDRNYHKYQACKQSNRHHTELTVRSPRSGCWTGKKRHRHHTRPFTPAPQLIPTHPLKPPIHARKKIIKNPL